MMNEQQRRAAYIKNVGRDPTEGGPWQRHLQFTYTGRRRDDKAVLAGASLTCDHPDTAKHSTCARCHAWVGCASPRCSHPACKGERIRRWVSDWLAKNPDVDDGDTVLIEAGDPIPARRHGRMAELLKDPSMKDSIAAAIDTGRAYRLLQQLEVGEWTYSFKGIASELRTPTLLALVQVKAPVVARVVRYQRPSMIAWAKAHRKAVPGGLVVVELSLSKPVSERLWKVLTANIALWKTATTESRNQRSGRKPGHGTKKTRGGKAKMATVEKSLKVGANAQDYMDEQKYGVRKQKELVKSAEAEARERGARIIRLEYILLADGTISSPRQFGSKAVTQLRARLSRQRHGNGNGSAPKRTVRRATPPRKRQSRARAKA